jgi:hypothetical protein
MRGHSPRIITGAFWGRLWQKLKVCNFLYIYWLPCLYLEYPAYALITYYIWPTFSSLDCIQTKFYDFKFV